MQLLRYCVICIQKWLINDQFKVLFDHFLTYFISYHPNSWKARIWCQKVAWDNKKTRLPRWKARGIDHWIKKWSKTKRMSQTLIQGLYYSELHNINPRANMDPDWSQTLIQGLYYSEFSNANSTLWRKPWESQTLIEGVGWGRGIICLILRAILDKPPNGKIA